MNNTFKEIWDALMKAERVLIPLHTGPDPDSMASCVAFGKTLETQGKQVMVVSSSPILDIERLQQLPILQEDVSNIDESSYDLFLALDSSNLGRYSREKEFSTTKPVINIDHHQDNTGFGLLNYVDLERNSTCEILYLLLKDRIEIDANLAEILFMGMVSDNGWFQYEASPESFDIAKGLIQCGVNPRVVSYELRKTTILNLQVLGRVYSRVQHDKEGDFVYSYLTYADMEELDIINKSVDTGVNSFKYLDNSDFGILITEKEPGRFSGSMRTREAHDYDVSKVAHLVNGPKNGGGHKMAAAFKIEANNVEDVLVRVREVVKSLR